MNSVQFTFRPVEKWPREEARSPKRANFSSLSSTTGHKTTKRYDDIIDLLDREIWHAGAKKAVIQAHLTERDLRVDGQLRSNSSPKKPGVIVSFEGKHGPISMPCDAFDHWKDNLYAIAKALEALRMVDRYGVTSHGEQYRGWKALPAVGDDIDAAARFVALHGGTEDRWRDVKGDRATFQIYYRHAARKTHPDTGGDGETFRLLTHHAAILRKHLGLT